MWGASFADLAKAAQEASEMAAKRAQEASQVCTIQVLHPFIGLFLSCPSISV
jgi:hypothetical protein